MISRKLFQRMRKILVVNPANSFENMGRKRIFFKNVIA